MRPNPQERRCPAPGSHVGIATERFEQAGEAVRSEKSLGRLQPRLVGSLRKYEEEAFAQGYCSLYPRVSNTRAWHKPAKMFTMWPFYRGPWQSIEAPGMSTVS
jgi:hypothetical protein